MYYFFPSLFLSYAVSFPPSIILIRFLILLEQRVAQNLTQLKGKGQQFLFFRRNLPLAVTPILSAVVQLDGEVKVVFPNRLEAARDEKKVVLKVLVN